ncbi:ferritin-like domain-containing protein [Nocardiopsis lucentensis]|uniref:ferritin-like domain-containing protein n=1 Tax=Nocardiopsis lucentensis TaxID=53441 RepID=UPI000345AEB0|nr:ferritin-like domain-containing protein [Nocardiopsis lucentensis]
MSETTDVPGALAEALGAEHAAVYGYEYLRGVAGDQGRRDAAGEYSRLHKALRDTLHDAAVELGVGPETARSSYPLPSDQDAASLDAYAVGMEETTARAYVWLTAADDPALRSTAARALQAATVRALVWGGGLDTLPGFEEA